MINYNNYKLTVEVSTYSFDGNLAIVLKDWSEGYPQPYAVLTVNLGRKMPSNMAFVDTNNIPWAEKFIKDNNLGVPTGLREVSGFCSYPLYKFDLDRLKECGE